MNVIAGVAIGVLNTGWVSWIVASFVWGFIWLAYLSISRPHIFKEHTHKSSKWHTGYVIEYATATSTALLFSFIVGLFKVLIS